MKKTDFSANSPGKLVPVSIAEYPEGPFGDPRNVKTHAFIPNDLPPKLDWDALRIEHFDLHSATIAKLGEINGLHRRIGNAAGLLRTLWMREAKLSSEIENIETTAEAMVLAGAGRVFGVRESSIESWNYVRALEHGIESEKPWSVNLIKEMHEILLNGISGNAVTGELRKCNVYIGDQQRGIQNARFIPMPWGDDLLRAMSSLEKFVNKSHNKISPLFAIALTHYQFETIHPFPDGNGRIGRVLISRSLVKEKILQQPVVYMSAYINAHKRKYVDLLLNISRHGGDYWSRWIEFILDAIRTQALDAIWRSDRLITLREQYHDKLKTSNAHIRLFKEIDDLFSMPAINVVELAQNQSISAPTARKDIELLEKMGILEELTGKERDRHWVAREIINVIEQDSPDLKSERDITT